MKAVKKYEANDGTLFSSESKALRHEKYLQAIREAEEIVIPKGFKDSGCSYANGGGFFQLTEDQLQEFISAYGSVIKKFHPKLHEKFLESPGGMIGRYLCDSGKEAYSLWSLFHRIDISNRVWGQGYYALHPSEGQQINLSKKHPNSQLQPHRSTK